MKPLPIDVERAMRVAAKMPLLPHHQVGRRFDIMESDVAAWLTDQAEMRQLLFNWARRNGAIQFDLNTGRWRGTALTRSP